MLNGINFFSDSSPFSKPFIVILRYTNKHPQNPTSLHLHILTSKKMGITKTTSFNSHQNRVADLAKALAHPARVAILEILLKKNTCICGDIVEELPLAQSTISQHLRELQKTGLIKGSIDPPRVCYCIDEQVWKEAQEHFAQIFGSFNKKGGCC